MSIQDDGVIHFTAAELLATRLIERYLFAANVKKSKLGFSHTKDTREPVAAAAEASRRYDLADHLRSPLPAAKVARAALDILRADVRAEMVPYIGLEAYCTAALPPEGKWKIDRQIIARDAVNHLAGGPCS